MNKFTKQCVAAFASLAMAGTLCVAGAVVANNVAFATGPTAAKKAPWDLGNEATTKKGSITIKKYKDEVDNGSQKKSTPINGAEFKITKVLQIGSTNIDLKKRADWVTIAGVVKKLNEHKETEAQVHLGTDASSTQTKTTGQPGQKNGEVAFTNLELGLYKVEETKAAEGYSNDVAPFYVTVPQITREDKKVNNIYTYDVVVEPKNAYIKDSVTKTADTTKMVGAGDEITYTIKAKLNKTKATNGNKNLTENDLQDFAIYDDVLTSAYKTVNSSVIAEVKINGDTAAMTKDQDYTVSEESVTTDNGINTDRKRIKVTFKKGVANKGLQAIAAKANVLDSKPVEIDVTVKLQLVSDLSSFVGKNKVLENKSGFIPGHGDGIQPKPTPGGSATTEFRKFHIKKVDATDKTKALNKAEFKAFANEAEAKKCAADPSATNACSKAMTGFADAVPQTNTEATITTTGVDGNKNGVTKDYIAKVTDQNSKIYLVEVKAPDGYTRSDKVHEVSLTSGDTAQEIEIVNIPDNKGGFWFNLPKTGAAGVIIFALAGMCLVAVGMFIFLRNRKKDEEQQNA
ncbi:SpaH/EbpB family LPXTG-anchored major pilin [Gardnerella swidsinskii]|uniref:SpaH/EbpB family LPXTG-anchored major pilin n=1 Tax=Gardnerella swidsinskii TaxID=2792979 RepID=UPI000E2EF038|nr:SpaH/EbpB family LPXTG-anchored major pilin [Gardnerella swidsinskii]